MILASTIGSGAVSEFTVLAGAALNVGVGPVEIKEIVYQSVAYVGMGRAFDFVHAANAVLTDRKVQLPLEGRRRAPQAKRGGEASTAARLSSARPPA